MWQANGVGTTPRDELELHDPIEFGHGFVALFPISVETDHFVLQLINHQDVRGDLTLGILVFLNLKEGIDVINAANPVFVLIRSLTFDLVIGLFRGGFLRIGSRTDHTDVPIETGSNTALKFVGGNVLNLSHPLSGVEISRGEW